MTSLRVILAGGLAIAPLLTPLTTSAQAPSGKISLELNNIQATASGGCRLSMIATNGLDYPVDQFGLEVVAFNKDGLVDQFLRLDFTRISAGKTKILQFDLADKSCDAISRLHINNVLNCMPAGTADIYCPDLLSLSNRTAISFGD